MQTIQAARMARECFKCRATSSLYNLNRYENLKQRLIQKYPQINNIQYICNGCMNRIRHYNKMKKRGVNVSTTSFVTMSQSLPMSQPHGQAQFFIDSARRREESSDEIDELVRGNPAKIKNARHTSRTSSTDSDLSGLSVDVSTDFSGLVSQSLEVLTEEVDEIADEFDFGKFSQPPTDADSPVREKSTSLDSNVSRQSSQTGASRMTGPSKVTKRTSVPQSTPKVTDSSESSSDLDLSGPSQTVYQRPVQNPQAGTVSLPQAGLSGMQPPVTTVVPRTSIVNYSDSSASDLSTPGPTKATVRTFVPQSTPKVTDSSESSSISSGLDLSEPPQTAHQRPVQNPQAGTVSLPQAGPSGMQPPATTVVPRTSIATYSDSSDMSDIPDIQSAEPSSSLVHTRPIIRKTPNRKHPNDRVRDFTEKYLTGNFGG